MSLIRPRKRPPKHRKSRVNQLFVVAEKNKPELLNPNKIKTPLTYVRPRGPPVQKPIPQEERDTHIWHNATHVAQTRGNPTIKAQKKQYQTTNALHYRMELMQAESTMLRKRQTIEDKYPHPLTHSDDAKMRAELAALDAKYNAYVTNLKKQYQKETGTEFSTFTGAGMRGGGRMCGGMHGYGKSYKARHRPCIGPYCRCGNC